MHMWKMKALPLMVQTLWYMLNFQIKVCRAKVTVKVILIYTIYKKITCIIWVSYLAIRNLKSILSFQIYHEMPSWTSQPFENSSIHHLYGNITNEDIIIGTRVWSIIKILSQFKMMYPV